MSQSTLASSANDMNFTVNSAFEMVFSIATQSQRVLTHPNFIIQIQQQTVLLGYIKLQNTNAGLIMSSHIKRIKSG